MKRLIILSSFLSLFGYKSLAQNHQEKIRQIAQIMLDATIKQDYSTVLNYSYPKIIAAHGGKDSVLNSINEGFKKMKAQGMDLIIKSGTLGEPGNEVKIDSLLYSVISEKLILSVNGASYVTTGSLVAISSDNGENWTFVDAAGLEDLKVLIPNINKLNISKSTGPTLIKDK